MTTRITPLAKLSPMPPPTGTMPKSLVIPPVDLDLLESYFAHMERLGIFYGLGKKLPLSVHPDDLEGDLRTDCSGFVRYLLYWASNNLLDIGDGSQVQRAWAEEKGLHKLARYSDANAYMTDKRLFIAFIKPYSNGARKVGHVWLVSKLNADSVADTMESYGGVGIGSRPWNNRTLLRQVYSTFELPVR